jgi:hypothetical protein
MNGEIAQLTLCGSGAAWFDRLAGVSPNNRAEGAVNAAFCIEFRNDEAANRPALKSRFTGF